MTPAEIHFVRDVFGLTPLQLTRALGVSVNTVVRWESGENSPSGLQEEVLRALHLAAVETQHDEARRIRVAGLIQLGIGALLFYLLRQESVRASPL